MRVVLIIVALAVSLCSVAQTRLQVVYKATNVVFRESLEQMVKANGGGDYASFLDGIDAPEFRDMVLYVDGTRSRFAEREDDEVSDREGPEIVIVGVDGGNEYYAVYKDVATGTVVSEQDFELRRYLVSDSAWTRDWRIVGEKKEVLGFECQKAVIGDSISAWFTAAIPIADGPDTFWGLPGLILELHDVKESYECVEIAGSSERVRMPKMGKVMTSAEFLKFKEDHLDDIDSELSLYNN